MKVVLGVAGTEKWVAQILGDKRSTIWLQDFGRRLQKNLRQDILWNKHKKKKVINLEWKFWKMVTFPILFSLFISTFRNILSIYSLHYSPLYTE